MVTVTKELLEQGLSRNGCLNGAQAKVLGVKKIFHNKGWKSRLIGIQITEQQKKEFLSLTNTHLKEVGLFGDTMQALQYQYECRRCGKDWKRKHKETSPDMICPRCGEIVGPRSKTA